MWRSTVNLSKARLPHARRCSTAAGATSSSMESNLIRDDGAILQVGTRQIGIKKLLHLLCVDISDSAGCQERCARVLANVPGGPPCCDDRCQTVSARVLDAWRMTMMHIAPHCTQIAASAKRVAVLGMKTEKQVRQRVHMAPR